MSAREDVALVSRPVRQELATGTEATATTQLPNQAGAVTMTAPCWDGPGRLWSLLDMHRLSFEPLINLGMHIQYWTEGVKSGDALSAEHKALYVQTLEAMNSDCVFLGLKVTKGVIGKAIKTLDDKTSFIDASNRMGEIHRCLESEGESHLFFHIPSDRADYMVLYYDDRMEYGSEARRFIPILRKFESAIDDVNSACNCYGSGNFTAAVFHLMRVCEYGLVSLCRAVDVDPSTSSWEGLLKKIKHTLDVNSSQKPSGWKHDEQFYSEAAALLINVKNAWRNSVSHIRRTYTEDAARIIFNNVEALMLHLCTRLAEPTVMPERTALSVPDAEPDSQSASA
jgi:hypothetical protein